MSNDSTDSIGSPNCFPIISKNDLLPVEIPVGSEIYQEMLSEALANYFGAKLLIFDTSSFLGVSSRIQIILTVFSMLLKYDLLALDVMFKCKCNYVYIGLFLIRMYYRVHPRRT